MTMTDEARPSRDHPRHVGQHQIYYHGEVLVIVYSGDIGAHEMRAIVPIVVAADHRLLATVADVGGLGSFGLETRKALLDERVTEILGAESAPLGVFVVNADVVRRAIMKFVALAARLLSKRGQRVYFLQSREEAEERAAAYHAEHAGRRGESPRDGVG